MSQLTWTPTNSSPIWQGAPSLHVPFKPWISDKERKWQRTRDQFFWRGCLISPKKKPPFCRVCPNKIFILSPMSSLYSLITKINIQCSAVGFLLGTVFPGNQNVNMSICHTIYSDSGKYLDVVRISEIISSVLCSTLWIMKLALDAHWAEMTATNIGCSVLIRLPLRGVGAEISAYK